MIRQKLAQAYIRVDVMRLNNYRSITNQLRGQPPGPEASLDKLYWSEMNKWMQEIGQEILGPILAVGSKSSVLSDVGQFAVSVFCGVVLKRSIPGPRKSRGISLVNGSWVYREGDAQHGILVRAQVLGRQSTPGTASGLREGEAYVRTFEMGHH